MKPSIYIDPVTSQEFGSLGPARRAFTHRALKGERIAMVREHGLVFEVTVNEPRRDEVTKHEFLTKTEVEAHLMSVLI